MPTEYFKFNYTQLEDGKITNQGTGYYYTTGRQNLDEMKALVRKDKLQNPAAVVTIQNIVEIDRGIYTLESGHEPAV